MSAPIIQSFTPYAGETDVVLGRPIEILFDQPIDPASVSTKTFSLMGPGQTSVVDAENLLHKASQVSTGREYIPGEFSFPAPAPGDTWLQDQKLVFTCDRALRPNVVYTLLLLGKGSLLATAYIRNLFGEGLAKSIQTTFTTGEIDMVQTPPESPLMASQPWEKPRLSSKDILVRPRRAVGNDLTQEIDIVFPGPIDPNSFDMNDLIVAGEPFLNDPQTQIPDSTATVQIDGNTLRITVLWGMDPSAVVPLASLYSAPGESGAAPDASDYGYTDPENNPYIRPA